MKFFLAWILPAAIACQSGSPIDPASVQRRLSVLSADAMEGRKSFTAGNDRAARWISGEMQRIGLKPMPSSEMFENKFSIMEITPDSISVLLGDQPIPSSDVIVLGDQALMTFGGLNASAIRSISKDQSFREVIRRMIDDPTVQLILVDPSHEKIFHRYQRFLGRRTVITPDPKSAKIFVLSGRSPQIWSARITQKVSQNALTNLIGVIPGERPDDYIIFSSHYDHLGILKPVNGDSIANGADDDASGVTAVLTLADSLRYSKPERTLLFVLFAAEEIGGYGSEHFSGSMKPEQIAAMINIEMIGKPARFGPHTGYITGYDRSDLGKIIQDNLKSSGFSLFPDPYPQEQLFYRSDNATLAKLGVPAHTISTSQMDIDSLYHTVNDEIESLDIPHMVSVIRGIAVGTQSLLHGAATPTRIAPDDLEKK